jgi:hypothetical protein
MQPNQASYEKAVSEGREQLEGLLGDIGYSWRQRLLGDGRCGRGHLRVLSKLVLSGDDDTVALGKPQCNHGAVIGRRSGCDRTRLDHIAFGDYPGEYPVGPELDGRRRNRENVAEHVQRHPRIHEVSGPKLLVFVGEHRFHAHRRGGLIDHVVDEEQCAFAQGAAVVPAERSDLDRPARHGVAHVIDKAKSRRLQG